MNIYQVLISMVLGFLVFEFFMGKKTMKNPHDEQMLTDG